MRVDPQYINNTVAALGATAATEQNLTNQLSSGVKVNSISDDPTAFAQNVLLSSQLSADDTFAQTASSTQRVFTKRRSVRRVSTAWSMRRAWPMRWLRGSTQRAVSRRSLISM